jgi:AmmeMemoRadiSam system protein B
VAGTFYPRRAEELSALVDSLLEAVGATEKPEAPRAFVVPHAGLMCSGPTAATAYARVNPSARTVALLGPSHYVKAPGLTVPAAGAWATPLGEVLVDLELCDRLAQNGLVVRDDRPHRHEHSLEVQLPFLQRVLAGDWACVPIAVGPGRPVHVADCLDALTSDPSVLVLTSTDLSHYHDEAEAHRLDRRTCRAVLDRDPDSIGYDDACGADALRGLLAWVRRHDLAIGLLDRSTSADTCADASRVVGYAAFAVTG